MNMNGMLLGVAMLVSSTSPPPALVPRDAAVGTAMFSYEPPKPRPRDLSGGLLTKLSRPQEERGSVRSAQTTSPKRFRADRIIAVAVGASLGFVTGGRIGYAVTPKRGPYDDTSGLKGVMIGAPIGGVVGALIGYRLTK